MIYSSNIFVVADPTTDNKPVLDRVSRLTNSACSYVHFFLSDYPDKEFIKKSGSMKDAKTKFLKERLEWLDDLISPLAKDNLKTSTELYWNQDWHEAIPPHAAVRRGSNLIIKSSFAHTLSKRKYKKTSDWLLIRRCVSPILFVHDEACWDSNIVLAAVNLEAADEEHTRLNQAVIQRAKTIAQLTGMKVALVSTISGKVDFKSYIEDADADLSTNEEIIGAYYGLDPADIYLSDDKPKKAIIKTSKNINADIVVIGSVGRSGIAER